MVTNWTSEQTIASLPVATRNQLAQVQNLFTRAWKERLLLDLKPDNLRVLDSMVYLIDFVESSEDALTVCMNQALTLWSNGNPHIRAYLTPEEFQ